MIYIIVGLIALSTWAVTSLRYKSRMIAAQNADMHRLRGQADSMDYLIRGYREGEEYRRGIADGKLDRKPLATPQGVPAFPQEYAQFEPEIPFRGRVQ